LPRLLVIAVAALAVAGCGGHGRPSLTDRVVTGPEWKAVLNDWYDDGRIEGDYSCAAAVIASSHLPADPGTYSDVIQVVDRYAVKICTTRPDLAAIKLGMADTDVAALAGAPELPAFGSCWQYRSRNGGNARLTACFRNGRVVSDG
jgi:hypothetical protein